MKCVILAGGSGSRLWPLSRDEYPKQLLSFDEQESLLQKTFKRLITFSKASDIVTVTNVKHAQNIKLQLNNIASGSIILSEPMGKNTAPAIASALRFFQQSGISDDIVLIVPSDHLIKDINAFNKTVEKGKVLAEQGYIVTFGIKPDYPETGYGYIKITEPLLTGFKVEKFEEKPNLTATQKYIEDDKYYWNSGIFMGKISSFTEEFKKYAPEIFDVTKELDFSDDLKISYTVFEKMPVISIDYAIMEKSDKLALVELLSDWADLGSWQAMYKLKEKDSGGNVIIGKVVTDNVKNSLIYSQKEVVAVSGLENIILVETEDAIMACPINNSQSVKKLYEKLKSIESDTTKLHKTVFRPWGYYTCMNSGDGYLTKTICVLPKQKLSVQSHEHRSEHWVVLEGKALVLLNDKEYYISAGESIDIPVRARHSLQNPYDCELKIIEVQKGDYLSEDDIIRYEDCYGRV